MITFSPESRPFIVGLTGPSCSGKTMVSQEFEAVGFYVIDCDKTSRSVTVKGEPCTVELGKHFPGCVDENNILDRRKLGSMVFGDADKLALLNSITHPYIDRAIEAEILDAMSRSFKMFLLDAPTLYEAGLDSICEKIIICTADRALRIQRMTERDALSLEAAEKRADSQPDSLYKEENSFAVLYNHCSMVEMKRASRYLALMIKEICYEKEYKN